MGFYVNYNPFDFTVYTSFIDFGMYTYLENDSVLQNTLRGVQKMGARKLLQCMKSELDLQFQLFSFYWKFGGKGYKKESI